MKGLRIGEGFYGYEVSGVSMGTNYCGRTFYDDIITSIFPGPKGIN